MGIKDQFQDKARELAERAKASGKQDEVSERASEAVDQAKGRNRDTFDGTAENFEK
ncbi:hypothetical protein ACFYYB_31900 [Streptomyces sp. NPDC002886]|uniref:hypothetical protein n=1 Tax=Streptomyces sp. NPDC002886 TaxID=3364667 RepID=UPI0036C67DD2